MTVDAPRRLTGGLDRGTARKLLFVISLTLIALQYFLTATGRADALETLEDLTQSQFADVSRMVAASTHYRGVSPAEPLGILGLDAGLSLTSTDIDADLFDVASAGDFDGTELVLPRLQIQKGLPFGFDLGASLAVVPDSDMTIVGGEIRYSVITGGVLAPALAIRAAYSTLQGQQDIDVDNTSLDVSVSKGFLLITPYAGAGIVKTRVNPRDLANLQRESFDQRKIYAGITLNLGFAVTLELDQVGDYRSYSGKVGFRF